MEEQKEKSDDGDRGKKQKGATDSPTSSSASSVFFFCSSAASFRMILSLFSHPSSSIRMVIRNIAGCMSCAVIIGGMTVAPRPTVALLFH